MKVSAFAIFACRPCATDPIHGFSTGADLLNDGFGCMPTTQPCDLEAFEVSQRHVRHVDVEQPRAGAMSL